MAMLKKPGPYENFGKPEGVAPQVWKRFQNGRASAAEQRKVFAKSGQSELIPVSSSSGLANKKIFRASEKAEEAMPASKPMGISPQSWRSYQKGNASASLRKKIESRM